jgi:hypothetical protein
MTHTLPPAPPPAAEPERRMRPIYVRVILLEVMVIAGLWFFSWYFGR